MLDTIRQVVDPFLTAVDAAVGSDGYSALLFGSAARGDFVEGRSDINLMLVLDDVTPQRLRALGPAFTRWRESGYPPPLLISRDEWRAADDVFPIEITDMEVAHEVLRGPDPLAGLGVESTDLRRQLEHELRGKLVRLRQAFVAAGDDGAALGRLLTGSLPTIVVLLRGVLRLLGRTPPRAAAEVIAAASAAVGFPARALAFIAEHRGDPDWRCSAEDAAAYLSAVAATARFVDQHQPGDQG